MKPEVVRYDFDYYHRTIEKVYQDYYKKNVISLGVLLVIELVFLVVSGWQILTIVFLLLLASGIFYTINQYKKIPEFLASESQISQLSILSEDKKYYYIEAEKLKFLKKHTRNLPSQERGITFLIGVEPFNFRKPVSIRYYDSLEITYTEQFKLTKNNVSFRKSRWKHRLSSWAKSIPLILVLIYLLFFRLSFIWTPLKNLLSSLL